MFITDKIWSHLYPAVKDTHDDLKRKDFEKGFSIISRNLLLLYQH